MGTDLWKFDDNDFSYMATAQVGTEVIVYDDSAWGAALQRRIIDKVTATQIIVGSRRYWRKNGRQVGLHDSWRICYVLGATTARVQAVVEWRNKQFIRTECEVLIERIEHELHAANLDQLNSILQVLHSKLQV
jgi:hypothetical protein